MDQAEYENRALEAKKPLQLLYGIFATSVGLIGAAFGILIILFFLYVLFS